MDVCCNADTVRPVCRSTAVFLLDTNTQRNCLNKQWSWSQRTMTTTTMTREFVVVTDTHNYMLTTTTTTSLTTTWWVSHNAELVVVIGNYMLTTTTTAMSLTTTWWVSHNAELVVVIGNYVLTTTTSTLTRSLSLASLNSASWRVPDPHPSRFDRPPQHIQLRQQ